MAGRRLTLQLPRLMQRHALLTQVAACAVLAVLVAGQHHFVHFFLLKQFISDVGAPIQDVVIGCLGDLGIKVVILAGLLVVLGLEPWLPGKLASLMTPKWLLPLAIGLASCFLLPWHEEVFSPDTRALHLTLSLVLSEQTTQFAAAVISGAVGRALERSSSKAQRGYSAAFEGGVILSSLIIPVTQLLTENFTQKSAFRIVVYSYAAAMVLAFVVTIPWWPKPSSVPPSPTRSISVASLSVKFENTTTSKVGIIVLPPKPQAPKHKSSAWYLYRECLRSAHFVYPLIGGCFRSLRLTVNTFSLFFVIEIFFVQSEVLEPGHVVVALLYLACLASPLLLCYVLLTALADNGPVAVNHVMALLAAINALVMLCVGRHSPGAFALFLVVENCLSRACASIIYGSFEDILITSVNGKSSSSAIHVLCSLVPCVVESLGLLAVGCFLHFLQLPRYLSSEGFHASKCDPDPHSTPHGTVNRYLMQSAAQVALNGTEGIGLESDHQYSLPFFTCEGILAGIYLMAVVIPLVCAIVEFFIMYAYRGRFTVVDGKIVPT